MEKKIHELNAASSRAKALVGLDIQPVVKSKSNEVTGMSHVSNMLSIQVFSKLKNHVLMKS